MTSPEIELAERFGEIARMLLSEHELEATLDTIVKIALELVESANHAGIDLVEGRTVRAVAPSDAVAEHIDAIQVEVDEGPCLSAIREHDVFLTGDLAAETRWPRFAERAVAETAIRSIMGFRLFVGEDTMGALDFYSTSTDAFDEDSLALGSVLAAHAAVALSSAREREGLHEALRTRDLIGQAKGVLMAKGGVTEDEAFEILRRASQRMNVKLREVAERIVHPDEISADEPI